MGGEFSLFNDLEQFLLRLSWPLDLWKETVPDEFEVFPLDIVIQARNLQIDIAIGAIQAQGTHIFEEGDWWGLIISIL